MVYTHVWYLKDHLGNNRVFANESGNVLVAYDYDPFGADITVLSTESPFPLLPGPFGSPYKYGGKEWSTTTSTYDFEARQMAPAFHRFTTMDPLAEKYYGISPYAYCANNPVNCFDDTGRKIIFINGYPKKWTGAPGEGGPLYWRPDSEFVKMAKTVFSDSKTYFPDIRFCFSSSVDLRRKNGYDFAKQNYDLITGNLSDGESVRFVTHSMGAAFAEGMADYLLERGVSVDALIHFEPYQAAKIKTNGERDEILTVDYQEKNDWVIQYIYAGDIEGADERPRAEHTSSWKSIHTYSIRHSSSWEDIKDIIAAFLNNK